MDVLNTDFAVPLWGLVLGVAASAAVGYGLLYLLRCVRGARRSAGDLEQALARTDGTMRDLRESEEKYRHLYESAPVGIFRASIDGSRMLLANEAAARMYGYASEGEFLELCRPGEAHADPARREALIAALRENGRVGDFEILINRPDGSRKYLSLSAHLHEEQGYLEGALLDITSRKRAERELTDSHLFLQTVMDTMPNPLFYKDKEGALRHVNSAFEQFLGRRRSDVLGRRPAELLPEEVARDWDERSRALLDGGGDAMHRFDTWLRVQGGERRDVVVQESVVRDSADRTLGLVGVLTDVTGMKRIENDLREAWATYRNIFENAVDGIFTLTAGGRIVRANPAMARILGYDSPEDLMQSVTNVGEQVYADPSKRPALLARLREHGVLPRQELEVKRKDGSRLWVGLSLRGIFDEDGEMVRVEGVAADITEHKREEAELARRALSDPLTGLPNRAAFEREFGRMLAQARRSGQMVGVLFMDLDGFKPVNDTYGHQVGDDLLREVAKRLCSRLRVSDVAARIGGDEFGVLLWNVSGEETMTSIARQIIESVNSPVKLEVCDCVVGVSIGGSLYPAHGESAHQLIRRADKAMYAVKQSGRNEFLLAGKEPRAFDGDGEAPARSGGDPAHNGDGPARSGEAPEQGGEASGTGDGEVPAPEPRPAD